ncbi:hypothetical protein, partial [uncultured Olegusella sp.]|uniref:hypothetical protein n=1 Tax=uncultured Olegusella sp. TaxID=1979846 RepID=UPI00263766C4
MEKKLSSPVAHITRVLALTLMFLLLVLFLRLPLAYAEEIPPTPKETIENIQEEPDDKETSEDDAGRNTKEVTTATPNDNINEDLGTKAKVDTKENVSAQEPAVEIGDTGSEAKVPTKEEEPENNTKPSIKEATVLGNFDTH